MTRIRRSSEKPIKAGEITWRCWWDGGLRGPDRDRLGRGIDPDRVRSRPPGRRFAIRILGDDQVKQAVEALLESMKSSAR